MPGSRTGTTRWVGLTPLESLPVPRFHIPMFTIFRGGQSGAWRVKRFAGVKGESLAPTPSLSVTHSDSIALPILPSQAGWRLVGTPSHVRYVERAEKEQL